MDKSVDLFYTPPKDEHFNELKSLCLRFWEVFPEIDLWNEKQTQLEIEYAKSKIEHIQGLTNTGPNFVSMIQMIHPITRKVLAPHLSLETRNEISMRLYGWGKEDEHDPFNIWNIENNM